MEEIKKVMTGILSQSMVEEDLFEDRRGYAHPVLKIYRNEDDRYPFSFGVDKARLIVEHIQEIQQFVDKYSKE